MSLDAVYISSQLVSVIIGAILTFAGLLVLGFMTFFMSRLIKQLDTNTENQMKLVASMAVIESRLSALEHKTTSITVERDDSHRIREEKSISHEQL